ncbi:hypothetical protein [Ursidibacter sp. B-7004-1]
MKLKQFIIPILCASIVTGCAELAEVNQQVGEWAGKMIEIRDGQQNTTTNTRVEQITFNNYSDSYKSQSTIDNLFVRLKRELNLKTREAVPNVYYKLELAESEPKIFPKYYTTSVILEKEGKKTIVRWEIYATEEYAQRLEKRLVKAIK